MRVTLAVSTAFSLMSSPKNCLGRNAAGSADFFKLPFVLREQPQQKILFQFAQGAVGDEKEVATAASRVQHAESAKLAEKFEQFGGVFCGGDAFFPRADDGGADNFLNVAFVGEMRAKGVALRLQQAAFKERAEDYWLDARPILFGGVKQQTDFGGLRVRWVRLGRKVRH